MDPIKIPELVLPGIGTLSVILIGIGVWIKNLWPATKKFMPLILCGLGTLVGGLYGQFVVHVLWTNLFLGLFSGLIAIGLFSGIKNVAQGIGGNGG